MMYFLISLLLGAIPDVLYYYFYIVKIKNIKSKKLTLFFLIFICYFTSIGYNFYLYILTDILFYLIIKKLYKSKILDFFFIITLEIYMIILSIGCYFFIKNYFIAFFVYKVFLFIPLIFKNKLIKLYTLYYKLWNRHNYKAIKSITLRNISLTILNTTIILIYLVLTYITKISG